MAQPNETWAPSTIEVVAGRLWLSDRPTAVDLCTERGAQKRINEKWKR